MKTYWVYILLCADNSYYTGSTRSLEDRIHEHQCGKFKGYTSTRLPVTLVYTQEFQNAENAVKADRHIKNWRRKKKEALINGNFKLLHHLAESTNETNFKNK